MTFDNLTSAQKARAALHRDVHSICTESCHLLGLEMSRPAMEIVAELLYRKLTVYGLDLEAFAKHAKRTTINSDDVKLLARRNPSLKTHLHSLVPVNTNAPKKRQKSSIVPNSRPADIHTPVKPAEEATHSKTEEQNRLPLKDFVEKMAVDNTIDLTFE